jgi:flagellar hook-length control protein FliK
VDRAQAAVAADRGAPATRTAGAPAGPHLDGGAGGKGLGEASGTLPGQAAGTSPAAPVAGADAAVTPTAAAGAFTLPVDNAAQPAAPPAPQASAGAPFHAYLAAGVNSPGFAPALGTQLRMLVREGIGEANLELNPGEMGPVSVRIELEGRQAHVEFGADLAATRTALQESLPTLAAALREGGFTLSGGGVSERQSGGGGGQPEQRPGSGGGSGGLAAGQGDGAAATPAARQGAQARGVVDLFA